MMTRLHKFQEEISLLTIFLLGQKFQKSSPHSSADHGPSWLSHRLMEDVQTWKAERCQLRSRVMIRGRTRWRYGRHSVRHRCKNRGRHSGGRHSGRFPGSVQLDMVMNFVNPFQVIPHKVRSALGHTVSTVRTRFCNRVFSFSASPALSECQTVDHSLQSYTGTMDFFDKNNSDNNKR